jgi:hypothetical protein
MLMFRQSDFAMSSQVQLLWYSSSIHVAIKQLHVDVNRTEQWVTKHGHAKEDVQSTLLQNFNERMKYVCATNNKLHGAASSLRNWVSLMCQQIVSFLCHLKIHCSFQRSLSLNLVLSQLKPVHILTRHFFKIHVFPYMLRTPKWSLTFRFSE